MTWRLGVLTPLPTVKTQSLTLSSPKLNQVFVFHIHTHVNIYMYVYIYSYIMQTLLIFHIFLFVLLICHGLTEVRAYSHYFVSLFVYFPVIYALRIMVQLFLSIYLHPHYALYCYKCLIHISVEILYFESSFVY